MYHIAKMRIKSVLKRKGVPDKTLINLRTAVTETEVQKESVSLHIYSLKFLSQREIADPNEVCFRDAHPTHEVQKQCRYSHFSGCYLCGPLPLTPPQAQNQRHSNSASLHSMWISLHFLQSFRAWWHVILLQPQLAGCLKVFQITHLPILTLLSS